MNKGCKITLIILGIIFIGVLICGYYFLNILGDAFGAECEKTEKWIVQEYELQEYKCLGWAGPHYFPIDVYKNGSKIANDVIKKDSCLIRFEKQRGIYIDLDICENTIREIRAEKTLLDIKMIDSVKMYSRKNNHTKKLSQYQINLIVNDWNKSEVSDYRDKSFDSIFYPDYSYKLFFYKNGKELKFITGNYLIAKEDRWTYIMSKERNTEYFNEIWSME
jgi:hypothetical protein